jgi:hypothetical protein
MEVKVLRVAQNASHQSIRGSQSETQGNLWLESRIFQQEPLEMRFHRFTGSTGLPGNETCYVPDVLFRKRHEIGRR